MAKKPTIEHVEASLKKWRSRLKRAMTVIQKLERQYARLMIAKRPRGHAVLADLKNTLGPAIQESLADSKQLAVEVETKADIDKAFKVVDAVADLGIPDFLKRGIAAQKAANEVIEQIKAEQADTKKRKAQGRIAKMKAKKAGDLKKMPLTGKAALAAIDSD